MLGFRDLLRLRQEAKTAPSDLCSLCGKPEAWVVGKNVPGTFHVRCALRAEFEAQKGRPPTGSMAVRLDKMGDKLARRLGRE